MFIFQLRQKLGSFYVLLIACSIAVLLSKHSQVLAAPPQCDKITQLVVTPSNPTVNQPFTVYGVVDNCPNKGNQSSDPLAKSILVLHIKPTTKSSTFEVAKAFKTDSNGNFFIPSLSLQVPDTWTIAIWYNGPNPLTLPNGQNPNGQNIENINVVAGSTPACPVGQTDPATGACISPTPTSTPTATPTLTPAKPVDTVLGSVPTDPVQLIQKLLTFATGIGGGVALLLMISGAFQMITSAGNAEAVKKGQEQFSSAVMGLLFIIFSVILLQIIGVNILSIPGFK